MSTRNFRYLFNPRSLAIIGASLRPNSAGTVVLRNMQEGKFSGALWLVNPKYRALNGLPVYASVADLPQAPDLALICTPPSTIPGILNALGRRGTRAAVVVSARAAPFEQARAGARQQLQQAMLAAARPYLLRILGADSMGLLIPSLGLHASVASAPALPGWLAFVSQSGALASGLLDWARLRRIGFSKCISLGDSTDVDSGDVLDYLAGDGETQAILLYLQEIQQARKFMSAARAAARSKPVLVVKAGRGPQGATVAASHSGVLATADNVCDAAFRRAGMLRVFSTEDLFGAAETLTHVRPLSGTPHERLAIISNGAGPALLASDALLCGKGRLAALSEGTVRQLDALLPQAWSRSNPVRIAGDAPIERYVQTLNVVLQDPQVDAVLLIHTPSALVDSQALACALAPLARQTARNVIACWLGGAVAQQARPVFAAAGVPTYGTPEEAVRGFMQIVQYRRNQELLMQVPPSLSIDFIPDRLQARTVLRTALQEGRTTLSEPEAKRLLAAYGIPVVPTQVARSAQEAVQCAQQIGFPVALKVLSPDIVHKSDVGGVELNLDTPAAVAAAAAAIAQRLQATRPGARLQGFSVQAMAQRAQAHELIIGVATDPVFGPVILFGEGGLAVEITADHAIGLPPLNMVLAHELVARTRVASLLAGYRNHPAAHLDAICHTLLQVSQLVIDLAEVAELDINPLLADSHGVLALDARVRLNPRSAGLNAVERLERLAIRPYPEELEEWINWQGTPVLLRPIRPEDAAAHVTFFNALDAEDVRYRMFMRVRELQPAQLARLTQIDYDREMAFIASRKREGGGYETLGVARAVADPDNTTAEFAVTVRSDLKGRGLGRMLMTKLIDYCRSRGIHELVGETLRHNRRLLRLAQALGFDIRPISEDDTVLLRLDLFAAQAAPVSELLG